MPPLTLQTNHLRLVIYPDAGAGVVSFEGRLRDEWRPLMRPTPAEAVQAKQTGLFASFNLIPWSNRVVGAAFTFEGREYHLRPNTPQGFAIHGDARDRPWRVIDQAADSLTCALDSSDFADFNFPFPFTARIRYSLTETSFDTALTITNAGKNLMPAGFGFHPYFNRGFGGNVQDEVQVQFHASGVYPPLPGMVAKPITKESGLTMQPDGSFAPVPTDMDFASAQPIDGRDIDHCYSGWNGHATIAYPSTNVKLQFECDDVFRHVILYTPLNKPFFALEPVTHANDGFNLLARHIPDNGIHALKAGDQLNGVFRIHVTGLYSA